MPESRAGSPHRALERLIAAAHGELPADLVIGGANVVNVFSGEIRKQDVAIIDGRIAGLGRYEGLRRMDARGLYAAPGLIDAHLHLESSMLTPPEFARAVVPLGTTTVVVDPHEIANVLGQEGIRYMLEATNDLPLTVYVMLPSCVPATDLETAGARLEAKDLAEFSSHPRVLGLGEVMNYPGVLKRAPEVLNKMRMFEQTCIDGHAPGLSGKDLNAYTAAGARSDHESLTATEAAEKVRAGMYVCIREGSVARNLASLAPVVSAETATRCGLVSDDRQPVDLAREGHVNFLLQRAVSTGIPAVTAIRMVTINPATHYAMRNTGALAPGYAADVVLLEDLVQFRARSVIKAGREVAVAGRLTVDLPPPPAAPHGTVRIGWTRMQGLAVPGAHAPVKVIGVLADQLATTRRLTRLPVRDGSTVADPEHGVNKLAVVERHHGTGNVGVGFVHGLGLKRGAIASTVAHDSHNIIAAGADDSDMLAAIRAVEAMQGGLCATCDGEVLATLALPIAGLMCADPIDSVALANERLTRAARDLGSVLPEPFMSMSFLALPVLPTLRLTDLGLVDVTRGKLVPVFGED